MFLLTKFEKVDSTSDPRSGPSASCYLHTVEDPWGQTGNHHGEGWAVNCAIDVVPALIPPAPNLP